MQCYKACLVESAAKLRGGETELGTFYEKLESRFEAVEPQLQSFTTGPDFGELAEATDVAKERWAQTPVKPPLYGIPVGVKDIISVNGFETRAGSDLPPAVFRQPEAEVVTRLKEAGAIIVGKTVTTEFACAPPGPTRNPHHRDHTPGGSSSGSAAAVAAGLVPLALGTQTVGSVIRPAAYCGIVGFKPSQGRIPTTGVVPVSTSADQLGAFTQDISGMVRAASVLCSNWTTPAHAPSEPIIGIPDEDYLRQATERGYRLYKSHCDILADAGFELNEIGLFENIADLNDRHYALTDTEAAYAHAEWYTDYGDRYHPAVAEMVEDGREVDHSVVGRARSSQRQLRSRIATVMDEAGVDVVVTPAAPGTAPAGLDDTGDPVMNLPWTHAGVPVVTIPAGKAENELPVGLQCIASHGADEQLFEMVTQLAVELGKS